MTNAIALTHSGSGGGTERIDLPITGMTCAGCARRVEKQLGNVPGVLHAGVNFATSRATVQYNPARVGIRDLIAEIRQTGYEAAGTTKADFVVDDSARPSGSSHQLEQHLNALPGVVKTDFNLATRKVRVEYLADRIDLAGVRAAIEAFGYRLSDTPADTERETDADSEEYRTLRRKFWIAAVLSLPVLITAMAHGRIALLDFPGAELAAARADNPRRSLFRFAVLSWRLGGIPPPCRRHEHLDRDRHRHRISVFGGRHDCAALVCRHGRKFDVRHGCHGRAGLF